MYYEIFILGSLIEGPRYGYEIKKQIVEGFSACTQISNNSLYPILKKFEQRGVTHKHVEMGEGKPNRIVYTITEEGRRSFVEMLRRFPDSVLHSRDDFFMRLSFFHWMDKPSRRRLLEGREAFLQKAADQVTHSLHGDGNGPAHRRINQQFHLDLLRSELDVVQQYHALLDSPCLMDEEGHPV